MLIVPLVNDIIITKDDGELVVLSYTNYKTRGPAVYAKPKNAESTDTPHVVYFFDIEKVNGVKVQFVETQKVLRALGVIKRKFHLPQPKDTITILDADRELEDDEISTRVERLKLHAKEEISRGLQVLCENEKSYRLEDIIDIKNAVGGNHFSRSKFLKYYEDYRGHINR